jgi:hypothetical protein
MYTLLVPLTSILQLIFLQCRHSNSSFCSPKLREIEKVLAGGEEGEASREVLI